MLLFYIFDAPRTPMGKKREVSNSKSNAPFRGYYTLSNPHLELIMSLRLIVLASRSSSISVEFGRDGVGDVRQLLLLLLEVFCVGGGAVLVEPVGCFLDCVEDLFIS